TPCSPGSYSSSLGAMQCTACPAGTSNLKSGSISSSSCTSCGAGYYSEPGVSQCAVCPAGHYCSGGDKFACPAGTSNSFTGSMNSFACTICPVGSVSGPGSSQCNECPAGTFETGDTGQVSCCQCCAGFYSSNFGSKTCSQCGAQGTQSRGTSQPGSTSASACMAGSNPQPVKTCTQASNDICPAVIAKTPSKRSPSQLHADFCSISVPRRHWCKVLNGGMECVDTMNDLEMCGGCLEPGHAEDLITGARDCSAIEGVGNVQCKQGKCEIGSCRKGFKVSTDGRTCVRVKLADIHKRLSHASTKIKGWEISS
ncbi:hypothetical protein GG344DRAFT_45619, partial [Lentinula edodes]